MEKGMGKQATRQNFIVVTGAESTGKTHLAKQLAEQIDCQWVPEFSRAYIESLNRKYTITDVKNIAKKQIEQFSNISIYNSKLVIFDTGLIITKVWFEVVYNHCPDWLIGALEKTPKVLHLLCSTDLPWEPDPVRENGGAMREKLTQMYINELTTFGFPYELISGLGDDRMENAIKILKEYKLM